jgi:glucose/mannose-6-phosphate isomerase
MSSKVDKKQSGLEEKYKLAADTIRLYPNQLKQAWDEINYLSLPNNYKSVDNIVFCGMGGSALGARMVGSYAFRKLRIPLEIVNGYNIPNYTNNKSLVVLSSYSGTTEEIIECTYQAIKVNAKIFGITTGNTLGDILKKDKIPNYIFDPKYNPSKQPRMSIGYALGATLSLFNKLGFITVEEDEIDDAMSISFDILTEFHENAPIQKNLAHSFAKSLYGNIPILVASEHLAGTAYTIKNQINESAKTFSGLFEIPELNHHLMEGLTNPLKQKELLKFVFFSSKLYTDKIRKRYSVTTDVLKKNSIDYLTFLPRSEKRLSEVLETLIFGSFVVYYLTKLYKIDPMEIPWVNYFKKQLAK